MNLPTHVAVSCFDSRDSNVSKPKHTQGYWLSLESVARTDAEGASLKAGKQYNAGSIRVVDCDEDDFLPQYRLTRWSVAAPCVLDAYGRCVPEDCESYFDGCNTCHVPKDPYFGGRMGCTYMYCETPKEPKCLKYKTEKN